MRTLHIDPPSDTPNGAPTDVDAIFLAAGWTPGAKNGWDGHFVNGFVVGGIDPYGTPRVTGIVANPNEGPNTVEEAAVWLVEHAKQFAPAQVDADGVVGYDLPHDDSGASDHGEADGSGSGADAGDASGEPAGDGAAEGGGGDGAGGSADGVGVHETAAIAEAASLFGEPAEAAYGGEDETHGEAGATAQYDSGVEIAADDVRVRDAAGMGGLDELSTPSVDDAGDGDAGDERAEADLIDADFAPIEDEPPERDALDADLFPIRGIAWSEEDEPEAEPDTTGPIAYAASDLDALVREKLGRVSQIARELKAALQDGWTIDEFRSLQNLIVRIDRGEATDDAQARARFVAISERSQAMSRVDAHRDALEAALEVIGKARDYQGAKDFNPEVGWP